MDNGGVIDKTYTCRAILGCYNKDNDTEMVIPLPAGIKISAISTYIRNYIGQAPINISGEIPQKR